MNKYVSEDLLVSFKHQLHFTEVEAANQKCLMVSCL